MKPKDQEEAKRKNRFLKLEQVLFEFIEPILILFKSGNTYFFASAMPSEKGFVEEYLVVSVTPKVFKRYFREDVDLRFLFESNPYRKFFKISAGDLAEEKVKAIPFDDDVTEEMLPEPQLFASSHTAEYKPMTNKHDALETLYIDGNWEMEDFGKFSARYRDIYSFEQAVIKLQDTQTSKKQKKKLKAAFQGNSLHGGGSYVSFFKELGEVIPANDQYDLARVQYASPGKVELRGKGLVFDRLEKHVKNMISNESQIRSAYNDLRDYMSKSGFLDLTRSEISPSAQEIDAVNTLNQKLLRKMKLEVFDTIYRITDNNPINSAKISMSLFRRVRAASAFFAEGRAVFER